MTSGLVVAEGHGWFLRRYDRWRATQFLTFLPELPMFKVLGFGEVELSKAAGIVKRYADQGLTLADAHGLAIMSERRIRTCWSTDRHLALGGAALAI